jgi:TPR repeat protein
MEPVTASIAAGEAGPAGAGPTIACARCRADLSRVPAAARFCPRCGAALGAEAVEPDAGVLLRQINAGAGAMAAAAAAGDGTRAHSAMIDGYATALYHLGQRYEGGAGTNSAEAVRCYLKAARLGNLPALGRLVAVCLEAERGREVAAAEPAPDPQQTTPV